MHACIHVCRYVCIYGYNTRTHAHTHTETHTETHAALHGTVGLMFDSPRLVVLKPSTGVPRAARRQKNSVRCKVVAIGFSDAFADLQDELTLKRVYGPCGILGL